MAKDRFASVKMPVLEAIVSGLFRFNTMEQAMARLDTIRNGFVLSKNQPTSNDKSSLILWLRGYDINDEELEKGYLGHYAMLTCAACDDDKFTINVSKIESELKYHPQRKRPTHKHPNWGHPILRAFKKKKLFKTVDDAHAELLKLHEEYPEVSIPCTNKLYVIIYSKDTKPPAMKYVFTVEVAEDGDFYIKYEANTYQAPKELPGDLDKKEDNSVPETNKETKEGGGYFASKVLLKRSNKQKYVPPSEDE